MAQCRRALPVQCQRILRAMARDLDRRRVAYGWTQEALGERLRMRQAQTGGRLGCDRSRVSRALGGEEMPSRRLIEQIALILDAHAVERSLPFGPVTERTMRRWREADNARRAAARRARRVAHARTAPAEGAPPAGMTTHQDLLQVLGALVTANHGSQRAMCRVHTNLVRPTVQAALSDRNALSLDLLGAILAACGVQDQDRQAWLDAWWRLGWPRQEAAIERRREGYDYAKRSRGRPWR